MEHPAVAEVIRQHDVIERRLSGGEGATIESFAAALDEGFEMVAPDGSTTRKAQIVTGIRAAFGAIPGIRIEVRGARVVTETDDLVVVHYEEWQTHCETPNQRVSTAVFAPSKTAPLGLAWVALHETWLKGR